MLNRWNNLSVSKKILAGFIMVIMVASSSGIVGSRFVGIVASSSDEVISEKVPLKDVTMEIQIAMQDVRIAVSNYLFAYEPAALGATSLDIENALAKLDMFLAMLLQGSNSSAFQESTAGETYRQQGIEIIVPEPAQGELRKTIELAQQDFAPFREAVNGLIEEHKNKAAFIFKYGSTTYTLDTFLYFLNMQFLGWADQLRDAAKYNIPFQGVMDPAATDFAKWYPTFTPTDDKLAGLLKKYSEVEAEAIKWAKRVNEAETQDKKNAYVQRMESRFFNKADGLIEQMVEHITPILNAFSKSEEAALATMEEASAKSSLQIPRP